MAASRTYKILCALSYICVIFRRCHTKTTKRHFMMVSFWCIIKHTTQTKNNSVTAKSNSPKFDHMIFLFPWRFSFNLAIVRVWFQFWCQWLIFLCIQPSELILENWWNPSVYSQLNILIRQWDWLLYFVRFTGKINKNTQLLTLRVCSVWFSSVWFG